MALARAIFSRRFCSGGGLFKGKFYNREMELKRLQQELTPVRIGDAGKVVLLTGPKDSGKSALLREFWSRQRAGTYGGISAFVDLRERSNVDPEAFARNLASSFAESLQMRAAVNDGAFGKWEFKVSSDSVTLTTPFGSLEFLRKQRDSMHMIMAAFEGYMSVLTRYRRGFFDGFPTIFIDEANALACWATTPEGAANMEALLRFLVRISKQENSANVVLASSENFFKQWLSGRAPFRGHNITTATVGHLNEEEARKFIGITIEDDSEHRHVLAPKRKLEVVKEVSGVWKDVFEHYGGNILLLGKFVKLALTAEPGGVGKAWEAEKEQHLASASEFVSSGFQPDTLSPLLLSAGRSGPPNWTSEQWWTVVESLAEAEDGIVPFHDLAKSITGPALASMIEYDFLHYRVSSGWDRDVGHIPRKRWPIVMPVSRAQHLVMKELRSSQNKP